MRSLRRSLAVVAAVGVLAAVAVGGGTAATKHAQSGAFCFSGGIAAGQYASITVAGNCVMPAGQVTVVGNVTIRPGAVLNVITHATLVVGGNVYVDDGGSLLLGCSPEVGCSFTTHDRIAKALIAYNPASLIVHNAVIGSVVSNGGSNGVNCNFNPEIGSPNYTTFEDTQIKGMVTIVRYDSCWLGFIRNKVDGAVWLIDNTLADPDAMEVVTNFIVGNLECYNNDPAPQLGDSGGEPNIVLGLKTGQCIGL